MDINIVRMEEAVNKVILRGNLGADPEVRYTPSGQAVCNFRIATSEAWVDKQGQKQERVEWHRLVAWGRLAEVCGEYLAKGRSVLVEGKLQTRQWEDKDKVKRYSTEITVSNVEFLGGANRTQTTGKTDAEATGSQEGGEEVLSYVPDEAPPF